MKHLDLFSGIGGFALATEMVWDDVEHIFCDNDPFAQAIIHKHYPTSKIYGDIRTLTADAESKRIGQVAKQRKQDGAHFDIDRTAGCRADLLTGGFPCQPFSQAGRRLGTADDRHLWPEMLRVIREFHPRWVIGENVGGFITWSDGMVLEQVHTDLESEGYEVQAFIIPAVAVNAPHRRDRVWIVAHRVGAGTRGTHRGEIGGSERGRQEQDIGKGGEVRRDTANSNTQCGDAPDTTRGRTGGLGAGRESDGEQARGGRHFNSSWESNWLEVATHLCTVDDGLQRGLARPRGWRNAALKGAGNAIVPQVAAEIMKTIRLVDEK